MDKKKIWKVGTLEYTTLGLIILSMWLIGGDIPLQLKARAVGPSATILIKEIGVSEFLYGLIMVSWPQFTSIFLGPIVCYISDRHRGRWGRRIPFLLCTMPLIVAGTCSLGFTPMAGEWLSSSMGWSLQSAQLLCFFIAWALLDFGTSIGGFLFGALVNDVMPREVLGRFFAIFRMISLSIGVLFNSVIIEHVKENPLEVFCGVGLFYGLGILLLCWKVKEGEYPPPPQEEVEYEQDNITIKKRSLFARVIYPIGNYFYQCFSMPYYRWFIIVATLDGMCAFPINTFAIQYSSELGLSYKDYGMFLSITYTISLLISYPMGILADKFHPLRSGMVILALYGVTMFIAWLFVDLSNFGVFLVLHGVISGLYWTASASLSAKILPRLLYAQFSSAAGLAASVFMLICAPSIGALIDFTSYRSVFLLAVFFAFLGVWLLW